jgi:sugar O-acyltransferase (sialic acid O-acetyltransferase NeuD family)
LKKEIYLLGIGNYTEVIVELAQDCGYDIKGLYHYNADRVGETVMNIEIIDTTENLLLQDITGKQFAVTMGENRIRQNLANKIRKKGGITPSLIHPNAVVSPSAKIGEGCFIHMYSKISTYAVVGNDCVIDFNSLVAHHATLGHACYMSSIAMIGSYCTIGERVLFGMNSLILPLKLTLGDDCIVGGKANVTKSFPENCLLVGNPAKKLKDLS